MEFRHEPVLLQEVLAWMNVRQNGVYCDGTLGGGGHSEAILKASGGTAKLYGIDRDANAIRAASERLSGFPGFTAIRGNFHDAKALLAEAGAGPLDGALLDLGVSSPQLDTAERGFSYHEEAPLDMRMDQSQGMTAAELLNTADEHELTEIIRDYGEEKWAARIARMICEHRAQKPFETTFDLVHAVDAGRPSGPADFPGGPDCGERRTKAPGAGAPGPDGLPETGGKALCDHLPFAGRPDRKTLL